MRTAAVSLAIGAALLVLAIEATAGRTSLHVLRSNLIPPVAFVVDLPPGRTACQSGELVPRGTGTIRLRIGTFGAPGPRLALTVRGTDGRAGTRTARLARGWPEGDVLIPVTAEPRALADAEVCVRNAGTRRIVLAGALERPAGAARTGGTPQAGRMTIGYLEAEPRSWWSFAGGLGARVGAARDAFPGAAAFWLWIASASLVVAGMAAVLLRAARR